MRRRGLLQAVVTDSPDPVILTEFTVGHEEIPLTHRLKGMTPLASERSQRVGWNCVY